MSINLKTENCLYMDCGGCVNDEATAQEKQACENNVICSKFVNDEYIHMSNLGENARRNLEIGILQDELVKLDFEQIQHMVFLKNGIYVGFFWDHIMLEGEKITDELLYYTPTWQQEVLTKVKELINE